MHRGMIQTVVVPGGPTKSPGCHIGDAYDMILKPVTKSVVHLSYVSEVYF